MDIQKIYQSIIDNMDNGAYFVDRNRKILFWNHAAEEITGYTHDEIVGRSCPESMLNHVDENGTPLCQEGCPLFATNIDGKHRQERVFLRHKSGYRMPVRINVFPIYEEKEIIGSVELFMNDSPTHYKDELLDSIAGGALHDPLSGLPNRNYLESFLGYKMSEFRHFGRMFALAFAEIDDFDAFTADYGKKTADDILKNIGVSIQQNMRRADLVGRWDDRQFVGIYAIEKTYDAPIFAERIRQAIVNTEIEHQDKSLKVTASVGLTIPKASDTVPILTRRAIKLMEESVESGKNRVTVDPRMPRT
ncbi:MAG: GGDEF domain-containing protein [Lachnospiraceae bacterium]|nr:GGDEF domain-containing protein [Lachnospiraceae bacterium]